jgi:hypothetical protein
MRNRLFAPQRLHNLATSTHPLYAPGVPRGGVAAVERLATIVALLGVLAVTAPALAQTYTVDKLSSDGLTHFLHKRGLHAVGAQISDADDGSRRMVLFGFVASAAEHADALELSHKYLGDPDIQVIDSLIVKPSLGAAENTPAPPPAASAPAEESGVPVPPPAFRGPYGAPSQFAPGPQPAAAPTQASGSQWNRLMEHIGERGAPSDP